MKRTLSAVFCALTLAAGAALYAAESSTEITVKPSEMRNGETKTVTEDGKTISIRREGDSAHITIEGAGNTESLSITREGNRIRIGRSGSDGVRSLVIDGLNLDELRTQRRSRSGQRNDRAQTFFVCPNDETTLRVPRDKTVATYKCPIDGATMEKRRGHGFTFYFDDGATEL